MNPAGTEKWSRTQYLESLTNHRSGGVVFVVAKEALDVQQSHSVCQSALLTELLSLL